MPAVGGGASVVSSEREDASSDISGIESVCAVSRRISQMSYRLGRPSVSPLVKTSLSPARPSSWIVMLLSVIRVP